MFQQGRGEPFDLITQALIHHQELGIDYAAASKGQRTRWYCDSEIGIRRVEPLHLACIDFGWYFFACDLLRNTIRTFALRRIKELRLTGRTFKPRRFNALLQPRPSGTYSTEKPKT